MKIKIDTDNKIIILLDPVTFNEIDDVMNNIKNLINDDLNQWKIQTAPEKELEPFQPNPFPVYPQSPLNPYPGVFPNPQQPFYTGDPLPGQMPTTWCGDISVDTKTNCNVTSTGSIN